MGEQDRAKPQGYMPGLIFQRLSLPPAVSNPRDSAQERDDFCTALQWVAAQVGWDIPKVPVPWLVSVGMDLFWSGKINIFEYVQMSPRQGK